MTQLSTPWQSALGAVGEVLQGLGDIDQSIRVICRTQRGEIPCSDIGIDWMAILDDDLSVAAPRLTSEIMLALKRFEPRAHVQRVSVEPGELGAVSVRVTWRPVGGTSERSTDVSLGVTP